MILNRVLSNNLDIDSVFDKIKSFSFSSQEEKAEGWALMIDQDVSMYGWMAKWKEEIIKNGIITKNGNDTLIDWKQANKIN